MTDEHTIQLDAKTRAIRSSNRWAIQRLKPDGSYDLETYWTGGRRSLYSWCANHGVAPTRAAEDALSLLPESEGFRERS